MPGFPENQPQASSSTLVRHSHGLEQFFSSLGGEIGLRVLDLGDFTQANVTYITSLGHRLYSEDLLHTLDATFGPGNPNSTQADPLRGQAFLAQALQFPTEHFDAVLVWDTLEHLSAPLLKPVMDRLNAVLRPGAALLACFHAEAKEELLPSYSFRIMDGRTMQLHPRGKRIPAQSFNNRGIERLFEGFHSVKFFLTRDHLREVIVRK